MNIYIYIYIYRHRFSCNNYIYIYIDIVSLVIISDNEPHIERKGATIVEQIQLGERGRVNLVFGV